MFKFKMLLLIGHLVCTIGECFFFSVRFTDDEGKREFYILKIQNTLLSDFLNLSSLFEFF